MKKLSTAILAELVETKRKAAKLTQAQLAEKTGINRAQLSRLEQEDYYPSIPQLEAELFRYLSCGGCHQARTFRQSGGDHGHQIHNPGWIYKICS